MKPEDLVLRGYAEKSDDGSWFAICLDLNIYARSDSPEHAIERVQQFIHDYVSEAYTEDREHFADLIPRRAPLYFWMRYGKMNAIDAIFRWLHKRRQNTASRRFKTPLPMVPC